MHSEPRVSVIIPVYNRERYLPEAVRSVLAQSYPAFEVVLVDDGSTDNSAAIAREFGPPVRYSHQANAGQAAARNRGVELATGTMLAFLDSDDYWSPDKLAIQVDAFGRDPELEAVFGHVRQFFTPELKSELAARFRFHAEVMPGYVPGTLLIRRQAFERIGRFDTEWRVGEFVSWYAHARDQGLRQRLLPDVVLHRRLHDTNLGIRQRADAAQYVHVLKAALDRRRAGVSSERGGADPGSG